MFEPREWRRSTPTSPSASGRRRIRHTSRRSAAALPASNRNRPVTPSASFRVRRTLLVVAVVAAPAACKTEPPQDPVVEGKPVSAWIAASINPDNFNGQRRAWQVLRKAGGQSVAAIQHAMERETDPERRARIGLAFGFLCPSAVPAMREAEHQATGDVQTRIKLAGDFIASQDSMRRAINPADSVQPGC